MRNFDLVKLVLTILPSFLILSAFAASFLLVFFVDSQLFQVFFSFLVIILFFVIAGISIKVINDQIGTPTSSELISRVVSNLIDKFGAYKEEEIYGIYHVVAEGSCSWYDYTKLIVKEALKNGHRLEVSLENIHAISSEDFKSSANRPKNSVLSTDKIKSLLSIDMPDWKEDVKKTIKIIIKDKNNV